MSYFIFKKDSDNIDASLYKIAENEFDLNNLNINQEHYKIIEDSQSNFDLVKYGQKIAISYNENIINYVNPNPRQINKHFLKLTISSYKESILNFLKSNINHPLYGKWSNYIDQLNSLDVENIEYPLTITLEQYLKDQGKTSLNILQLP